MIASQRHPDFAGVPTAEEVAAANQKPLIRAIERKKTYKPSRDIDGVYTHRILFGASAGMVSPRTSRACPAATRNVLIM